MFVRKTVTKVKVVEGMATSDIYSLIRLWSTAISGYGKVITPYTGKGKQPLVRARPNIVAAR